jgi:glycosyltransferase involved in cell wall biosynthesis
MGKMIEGYDIICFSGDWEGDPLSKRHIMLRLAQRNRVLWVNSMGNRNPSASVRDLRRMVKKLRQFWGGCRRITENFHVLQPLVIPFHGNRLASWLNKGLLLAHLRYTCRNLGFNRLLTWSFNPSSAGVAGLLGEEIVIYHCVDDNGEFTGTDRSVIRSLESQLLAKADAVIVSSSPLLEAMRLRHSNVVLIGHGVEVEHFRKACEPQTVAPEEIAGLKRPLVGFFGLLADWVDLRLVRAMARARPLWNFVLIGKSDTDLEPLAGLSNVHLLGRREYGDLPAYCKGFDVAILPFVVNPLTLAANPLKLREYLAAGLPVVATDIPETRRWAPLVSICTGESEFVAAIEEILADGRTGPRIEISHAMDRESWDEKVEEMSHVVESLARSPRRLRVAQSLAEPATP